MDMRYLVSGTDIEDARALAAGLLADLPDRWAHTVTVAAQARAVRGTVEPADRELLVAAAWLHDVGYSGAARDSGFHQLDGARLLDRCGYPLRLTALVAHHSGASFVARAAQFGPELSRYPDEASVVTDALLYADQTTGPHGEVWPASVRIEESLRRHGPESANVKAAAERSAYLAEAVARVQARLVGLAYV